MNYTKIRLTVRPPRGDRKTWTIYLDKVNEKGERTQEPFKTEELKVINEAFKSKKIDYNSALIKVEEIKKRYLEKLEREAGIEKNIITNDENKKLLHAYWNREYLNRDIEEDSLKSAEYQFQCVLKIMGELSFYNCNLSQIKKKIAASEYSPETIRHITHRFNSLLKEAGSNVKLSKPKKQYEEISHITERDLEVLARRIEDETIRHLLYIGFYTGMREGEIHGLNRTIVDFKRLTIKVVKQITRNDDKKDPKQGKRRTIIFPEKIVPSLEHWLDLSLEERKKFRTKASKVFSTTAQKIWPKQPLKHVSIHDLRRSFVIHNLQEVGMNLTEVAMLIGDTLAVVQSNYSGYSYTDDGLDNLREKYNL